jgi:hypothetical protein
MGRVVKQVSSLFSWFRQGCQNTLFFANYFASFLPAFSQLFAQLFDNFLATF